MIKLNGIDPIANLVTLGIASNIILLWATTALAQRRPIADETLGNEQTIVTPATAIRGRPGDRIEGGARRGGNLFHSFRDFQVDAGRAVYFVDPGVNNILGRVTGDLLSEILGTLGVLGGDANLFLINPNGIIFGENARLDVGGSFVATTANAIGFGNQGFFDVADPNAPPLLTVQPSAFLFNQINPGAIENQSRASLGDDGLGNQVFGLEVPNRQNLVFLGGSVVNRGDLNAFGGRVELGSVGGFGTVGLATDGSLSFPSEIARADVRITDGSQIDVASNNRGNIVINARNIDISGGSLLRAGIFSGLGTVDSQAGDVVLNGTGEIQVRQSSLITNNVGANGIGSSGNVYITAGSLFITEGASLQAITRGQGDAGDVIIEADDRVVFDDGNAFSTVGDVNFNGEAVGNGGNVEIYTDSLEVRNGAQLQASTFGQGNAGNVIVEADDRVVFAGTSTDGELPSAAFSTVGLVNFSGEAVGNGGNVEIYTDSLEVLNGAQLQASTFGQGDAGDVIIRADDRVVFDDGFAFSSVGAINFSGEAVGNGGNVEIYTDSLEALNGAQLEASTFGQGNAGNVIIRADDRVVFDDGFAFSSVGEGSVGNGGNININTSVLSVLNGAQLAASTRGQGNAGNVIIRADDRVVFDDATAFSRVEEGGVGNGGNINIDTSVLSVLNGARLTASTRGQGNAGNVIIRADDRVVFDDSTAFSTVGDTSFDGVAVGDGGNVEIYTDSLEVLNGAQLQASTFGQGDAGDVIIEADDRVVFAGTSADGELPSAAFSRVGEGSVGNGGNINIDTNALSVLNGARLTASTRGQGNAGNVIIRADDRVVFDDSLAFSTVGDISFDGVAVGDGGNVEIYTDSLEVRNGAQLQASTFGQGDAGDVIIEADDRVVFAGTSADGEFPSAAITRVEEGGVGNGGNINIDTNAFVVRNSAQLLADTRGWGRAGNIQITADTVSLNGVGRAGRSSGLFTSTASTAIGRGGNITVRADSIGITDGAVVNAQTSNVFRGGNITLNADTFATTGGGQVLTTALGGGNAGSITLNADRITLSSFDSTYADRRRQFGSRVSNQGAASGLFANTRPGSSGQGGTIRITAGELNMSNRAGIVVNSQGSGVAGNMNITAQSIQLNRSRLTAETETGNGGNITLDNVNVLQLRNSSVISTTAGTRRTDGNGGNITIDSDFIVAVSTENSDIRADAFRGSGGNVTITTQGIFGIEPQASPTDRSDITASSELGVQGTIDINTPAIDPSRGLTELPDVPVDASNQIAQTCPTGGNIAEALGEFVVTGRGGLPANPTEILSGNTVLPRLSGLAHERTEQGVGRGANSEVAQIETVNPPPPAIVEAQGWQIDSEGNVVLIAAASARSSAFAEVQCHSSD
ncbi:filamentous hemagglutinin N-terminal domain-containing protein [Oculatella sp. LEGE 06141]|uniref:two-partner secretion domain-containing protein n=1 Tax=Oculatella sp. LEGE 06141 TaxID=1828648 RepID=UPI00187F28E5|nr:filamentous hemagglutinin N-terminal domain-containing protein [Oculatella sp. LEGE 06141]MBE9182583.1 filamentous hemagglutinin N-terminal domain-containing protein [Oculatella sp. LEGE 06141]